jgi:hypothetical protein
MTATKKRWVLVATLCVAAIALVALPALFVTVPSPVTDPSAIVGCWLSNGNPTVYAQYWPDEFVQIPEDAR